MRLVQERRLDLPVIIVSGNIGEEIAVEAMRAGASDYVMKNSLSRLVPAIERELRRLGADHPYVALLQTVPGIAWVLGYTIAAEIGDIERFPSPAKLCGYTGLCPRVIQSGSTDRRGPISKHGPRYLRWGLFEAALNACKHPTTASATSTPSAASAANAAPRSPNSNSPESSPRRSGTCSPATSPSLRQAPRFVWPRDGPFGIAPPERDPPMPPSPPAEEAIER